MKNHSWKEKPKRAPLWKWVLIVLIILAMPLFFSFYRNAQIQRALNQSAPTNTDSGKASP